MKVVVIVAMALALSACATVGKEISPNQLSQFKEGITTQDEVLTALGTPTSSTTTTDSTVIVYSFAHVQARPATFIPIFGMFLGGTDTRSSAVAFRFGPDGKLVKMARTDMRSGAGTGFASGKYQKPDYSLPQEAVTE
ncbi:hypothetical protein [Nitrosospira briensis]|uniref:hypothetical protein n=1 Tax=Nitrosospira briensis TaxID=35799 RepID=UPI000468C0EE|nr:hypothetical protein [Nitrosospira briensis]